MKKFLLFYTMLFTSLIAISQTIKQAKPNDIYYEIFIRSFADSNKDGIGDIKGIISKLDYLQQLGITGIWITPVHPSPTYHKYDVVDYYNIDKEYGTIEDYKILVKEAHKRNIKILLDMVVNHTSSKHPWFIASCKGDLKFKDFYVWSDTATSHGWYKNPIDTTKRFYAFFWDGMPDLNFDNKEVRSEIKKIGRYWLKDIGVDGFRLDAAQHIYEPTDVDKNNEWWTEFRKDMQTVNPNVYLLGEVWNKDSLVSTYLKSSLDGCFNFDLSRSIINAVEKNTSIGFIENLNSTRKLYQSINKNFTDVIFISNHDQDRYRSTFNNSIAKTKLAFTVLMTLPGIPFLYYGEEIGMIGKFPDENRREPFLWSRKQSSINTTWEKPTYSTIETVIPLDEQMNDSSSFYHYYTKLIKFRNENSILSKGAIIDLLNKDSNVIMYEINLNEEEWIVIHNVSNAVVKIPSDKMYKKIVFNSSNSELSDINSIILSPFSSMIIKK